MARMNASESKVSAARPESISLRTTIPAFIAKQMKLSVGDTLDWVLDKNNGNWFVTVQKKG